MDTDGSLHDAAAGLRLTPEHVRLYCEITETGTPAATANGIPVSQARADILDRAHLRDLYEYQHVPMNDIAVMAGCATATIRRLLQIDGVPRRRNYRRPPPDFGITREWLHREYVVKLRSIETLARERGVTAYYLMSLAKNWRLPIRHHSQFSGIGHLDLPAPPSPAMRAVTMRKGALGRLELITRIPGHDSLAAAARVLYGGRGGALRQMIHKIETAAGFTIIDRSSTPLATTAGGREFIQEALQILGTAQEQEDGPRIASRKMAGNREEQSLGARGPPEPEVWAGRGKRGLRRARTHCLTQRGGRRRCGPQAHPGYSGSPHPGSLASSARSGPRAGTAGSAAGGLLKRRVAHAGSRQALACPNRRLVRGGGLVLMCRGRERPVSAGVGE